MKDKPLSSSLEDYLEAIFHLAREKGFAHANHIADYLRVGKSSVSWALNQLSKKELINYTPYEAITLTEKGQTLARRVARRHDEIKNFLTTVLAVDDKTAEANACRMEHVVDPDILQRMKQFMAFLEQCPRTGREWMEGFAYFCRHGRLQPECPERLARAADQPTPDPTGAAPDIGPAGPAPSEALPKTSKDRDRHILQRLRELLAESGHPLSDGQIAVAEVFMQTEKHQTLSDICKQLRKDHPVVDMDTVEKTMQILCEHKIARARSFNDRVVYEHFHPESHHDHIFCVKCSSIIEFFDPRIETLQTDNARRADFRVLRHNLDIYGVCRECIQQESKTRSLDHCLAGEFVQVLRIVAEAKTQNRIAEMGLSPGTVVQVLNESTAGGNTIVMAGGTRLMLDAKTAAKIRIIPAPSGRVPGRPGRRRRHRHAADRITP